MIWSNKKLKEFILPHGWKVSFPKSWKHEYDIKGDQNFFYPVVGDLTFRITAMHVLLDGINAPVETIKKAFLSSVGNLRKKEDFDFKLEGFIHECMQGTTVENNHTIYRVSCGIAVEGFLLTVNIFASNQESIHQSLCYVNTICRDND